MAQTGIIALVRWLVANADRVLRLLQGMLARLPEIGGAMESAGDTLAGAGAALAGGAEGAGGELARIRDLIDRYEQVVAGAVDDLRAASTALAEITVPAVSIGEREVRIPGLGGIGLPVVSTAERTPLRGVAALLDRQVAALDGLSPTLRGARDGVSGLAARLEGTAAELGEVGALLRRSGRELTSIADGGAGRPPSS